MQKNKKYNPQIYKYVTFFLLQTLRNLCVNFSGVGFLKIMTIQLVECCSHSFFQFSSPLNWCSIHQILNMKKKLKGFRLGDLAGHFHGSCVQTTDLQIPFTVHRRLGQNQQVFHLFETNKFLKYLSQNYLQNPSKHRLNFLQKSAIFQSGVKLDTFNDRRQILKRKNQKNEKFYSQIYKHVTFFCCIHSKFLS